ncbi:hypothetical protein CAPTEDRAFT_114516 [Capitella teleta]|uniref:Aminotransferase class V domain-containing protein n=1 Tax=Capitella teleta TaxID=283909 RepID=R7TBD2_CAPTE|nr:hypothetical protein CAPTEDRAFT_114516 [Capitella teleta]|eukprot:ELT91048.1 hypothetical protein CAPTEDRAFT_114516 [Capitella teleta]
MKLAEFNRFDSNYTFLNHGSFGAIPNQVKEKQLEMMELREKNPNKFIQITQYELIEEARRALATFLGSDYEDIIFVENVSKGFSNILRSLTLAPGEALLIYTHTYGAMKDSAQAMVDRSNGSELLNLDLPFPIESPDDVISLFDEMLTNHTNIKIAILDHIAQPGILFPIQELVDVCKSHGVLTVVDGAHAPGHVDLDLEELGADFYIGTLYKWLFGPHGSSFQWVAERYHSIVQPAVTSFGYGSPYPENFRQQGTRDPIPFIVMPTAIDFFESFGGRVRAVSWLTSSPFSGCVLACSECVSG